MKSTAEPGRDKFVYFDFMEEHQKSPHPEVKRLIEQHVVIKDAMDDELLAMRAQLPGRGLRILDSGTANGHWLRDLAKSFPPDCGNTYVGTDISIARLPIPTTADITYHSQDITQPWPADWQGTFDLVHQRLTLALAQAGGEKGKQAIARLVGLLKPGGWIQLSEDDSHISDEEPEEVRRLKLTLRGFMSLLMGEDAQTIPSGIKGWLEDAGCIEVQERVVEIWRGRNTDPNIAKFGIDSVVEAARVMSSMIKALDADKARQFFPFPQAEAELMPEQLEAALKAHGGKFQLRVVWARKSLAA